MTFKKILDQVKEKTLVHEIAQLSKERKAVILAHYYQPLEIQDVADFVGDSLQLAQQAAKTEAKVVVMCGVKFMAESAALLCPDKLVLLPELGAGCSLADMAAPEALKELKKKYPEALVVCYVNSSAAVKAESYICCTSSNAVKVVNSLPEDREIIFVPDKNLGNWVQRQTGRQMILWEGCCSVHHNLSVEDVRTVKEQHPEAEVLVHPECRPEVIDLASGVFSTAGMINYVGQAKTDSFIIGTEKGLLHQLQRRYPDKKFYLASSSLICQDMKVITLEKLRDSLYMLRPIITIVEEVKEPAARSLERMLAIS